MSLPAREPPPSSVRSVTATAGIAVSSYTGHHAECQRCEGAGNYWIRATSRTALETRANLALSCVERRLTVRRKATRTKNGPHLQQR